jgi:hypothetical protein
MSFRPHYDEHLTCGAIVYIARGDNKTERLEIGKDKVQAPSKMAHARLTANTFAHDILLSTPKFPRESKINNLDRSIWIIILKHDIFKLQIAMNHTAIVHTVEERGTKTVRNSSLDDRSIQLSERTYYLSAENNCFEMLRACISV